MSIGRTKKSPKGKSCDPSSVRGVGVSEDEGHGDRDPANHESRNETVDYPKGLAHQRSRHLALSFVDR
jgi:hypothetical protein